MKLFLLIISALLITGSSTHAQLSNFNETATKYIESLKLSKTSVFYASCKIENGWLTMILSTSEESGILIEFRQGIVVNTAPLSLKNGSFNIDFSQTQGGMYTFTLLENRARELTGFPFSLALQGDLSVLLRDNSKNKCNAHAY